MDAVIPEEGVGYSLDVVWMFKDTNNREAVEKIIDFIGSDEGMESAAQVRSLVTKPGFEGNTEGEDLEERLIDYDAGWADENQDEIMKRSSSSSTSVLPSKPGSVTSDRKSTRLNTRRVSLT